MTFDTREESSSNALSGDDALDGVGQPHSQLNEQAQHSQMQAAARVRNDLSEVTQAR